MTTDACTRIWLGDSPWGSSAPREFLDASPAAHQRAMSPIERSIVMGYRADALGVRIDPGMITSFAAQAPDRRFSAVGVDATSDSALQDAQIAAESGAIGISVSTADQRVRPTDERVAQLLELCAHRGLVVFANNPGLSAPGSALEWADPALFDEAARTNPTLRFVFGDLGRAYTESTLAMLAKHPNVFATTGSLVAFPSRLRRVLVEAYEIGVCDKLLFGSGFPHLHPEAAIERIYGIATNAGAIGTVPRESLRAIVERDTLRELGIQTNQPGGRVDMEVERASS